MSDRGWVASFSPRPLTRSARSSGSSSRKPTANEPGPISTACVAQGAALACEDIEIVCADVRDLELPQGDLFLFAFNPFGPAVLEAFLDNAIDAKREGEIRFAIVNPTGKEEVLRRFGFDRMQRTDVLSPWWSWSLWRRPALAPSPDSGATARRATSSFNASKEVRP